MTGEQTTEDQVVARLEQAVQALGGRVVSVHALPNIVEGIPQSYLSEVVVARVAYVYVIRLDPATQTVPSVETMIAAIKGGLETNKGFSR